jgi:hypothetical protein
MRQIDILANHFEYKLRKEAQAAKEVDSTGVTLAVRPTANTILGQNPGLATVLQAAANKIAAANIRGGLAINSFITNANLVGGKWKINPQTSGLKITGSLVNDKTASSIVKSALAALNAKLIAALEKEFNRLSQMDKEGWAGTTITNHETDISGSNFEI